MECTKKNIGRVIGMVVISVIVAILVIAVIYGAWQFGSVAQDVLDGYP